MTHFVYQCNRQYGYRSNFGSNQFFPMISPSLSTVYAVLKVGKSLKVGEQIKIEINNS